MMRQKNFYLTFLVLFILLTQSLIAQVIIKKSGTGENNTFFLNEIAAIITDKDGTIAVEHVMPVDQRPEGYRDLDLKQGDEILMVNAQRVKLVKDLEKIYNELGVGETAKLGLRRGEEMFILSFNKIDPAKLPKTKIMIQKEGTGETKAGEHNMIYSQQIKISGAEENVKFLMGTGLIIKEKDHQIIVDKVVQDITKKLGELNIKEGDVIIALNGVKVKSLDQLSEIYDQIKTGEAIHLATYRGKQEISVKFNKPEAEGQVLIKEK